jgi:hypothetical protein
MLVLEQDKFHELLEFLTVDQIVGAEVYAIAD